LGRQREFKEHKRSDRRIRERISAGYGRYGTARTRENDIQAWGVTREVHSEDVVWMVRQAVRPGILGKNGEKLETMEGQETHKKRDDEDDSRGRRNQGGKMGVRE